jgi:predicted metal-dependent hydrolase
MFFRKKKDVKFPESVEVNSQQFLIDVEFYSKKSSSVNVRGNVLSFRLSSKLSYNETKSHFDSLLEKILKKLSLISTDHLSSFKDVFEKKEFMFADQIFYIILHQKRITKLVENVFYVDSSLSLDLIEKKLEKLLLKQFSRNLIDYVRYVNAQSYNYLIGDVIIKNVSSKWGHCTHDNNLLLNIKLLNAPKEVLDYVIYHELSHVTHKNHSIHFWREVYRFCPNYKELRRLLKQNPPSLFKLID